MCRVKCAGKIRPFQNASSKVGKFFLVKTKLTTPKCQNKKLKNTLNFDEQKTVWNYLVPTRRNLDFRRRGVSILSCKIGGFSQTKS